MKKRYIKSLHYEGEDRRQYMEDGNWKPLGSSFHSWLPIFAPVITVIGFVIAITVFAQTTKTTTTLACDTVKRVEVIERKDITTDNRVDNLEGFQREIRTTLDALVTGQNNTNIRLSRIEERLPK